MTAIQNARSRKMLFMIAAINDTKMNLFNMGYIAALEPPNARLKTYIQHTDLLPRYAESQKQIH